LEKKPSKKRTRKIEERYREGRQPVEGQSGRDLRDRGQ